MLKTIIIQPPLVQLNTPYPSGAYLKSFFTEVYKKYDLQGQIEWFDLSTELFHRIFCKNGLKILFDKSIDKALSIADKFEQNGDDNTAYQLRRYISQKDLWIRWIDEIVAMVCGRSSLSGREFCHEFVRSAHVPRGNHVETYLSNLQRDVGVDDSQIIASLSLADLADYITAVYDSNFALIRYAEHLACSTSTFSKVENGLNSEILNDFYLPLLEEKIGEYKSENCLFCVSIPFPGCFEAAVFTGKYIRNNFTNSVVAFGGGYVNTELRSCAEEKLFNYCDFLSYDKGYGSYLQLFDKISENIKDNSNFREIVSNVFDGSAFYKLKYKKNKVIFGEEKNVQYETLEKQMVKQIIPDFSGVDFKNSPRLADDTNPMHRIWNDGAWIKVYMAHGCYWHRCAFCDTSLDYVSNYCGIDVDNLYNGIYSQCKKAGVYGLHFVDEACPPVGMKRFAILNARKAEEDVPLTWWGNIRFEKSFTRDTADLLSYGGLTAVSAGIEIATGSGLDAVNKGIDIENIVNACCAFKEAGILIHSYMIFGFWNQSEQDLINSMETLRQLFANGLLDSAFWHKFTLTKHSTVYREWLEGKHKDLKPLPVPKDQFAENDIHWQGEEKSEKYSGPLNEALECWMHGEKLEKKVESYFPFKMPRPTIKPDFINSYVEKYEQKRDESFRQKDVSSKRFAWLGGNVIPLDGGQICWSYMGEFIYADVEPSRTKEIVQFLNIISIKNYSDEDSKFSGDSIKSFLGKKLFCELRGKGLCCLLS